jgi:hypothetical protein
LETNSKIEPTSVGDAGAMGGGELADGKGWTRKLTFVEKK